MSSLRHITLSPAHAEGVEVASLLGCELVGAAPGDGDPHALRHGHGVLGGASMSLVK